jgi:hypothetical protein
MHAAIKALDDTLLIRRLQERELTHEGGQDPERLLALRDDIASLERGLKILNAVAARSAPPTKADGGPEKAQTDARCQTPDAGQKGSCNCSVPAIENRQSKIENS